MNPNFSPQAADPAAANFIRNLSTPPAPTVYRRNSPLEPNYHPSTGWVPPGWVLP